jgi:nitrogen fixation/metabolism regulation signal transduction histidine kinase
MSKDDNPPKQTSIFKHEVKNQLSSISLALEQLRYEVSEDSADAQYCLDAILASCKSINNLVDNL